MEKGGGGEGESWVDVGVKAGEKCGGDGDPKGLVAIWVEKDREETSCRPGIAS